MPPKPIPPRLPPQQKQQFRPPNPPHPFIKESPRNNDSIVPQGNKPNPIHSALALRYPSPSPSLPAPPPPSINSKGPPSSSPYQPLPNPAAPPHPHPTPALAPPNTLTASSPHQISENLNLIQWKQIAERNPPLKGDAMNILSQPHLSDQRKGELLSALLGRKSDDRS